MPPYTKRDRSQTPPDDSLFAAFNKEFGTTAPKSKSAKKVQDEDPNEPDLDAPLQEHERNLAERYYLAQQSAVKGQVKAMNEWAEVNDQYAGPGLLPPKMTKWAGDYLDFLASGQRINLLDSQLILPRAVRSFSDNVDFEGVYHELSTGEARPSMSAEQRIENVRTHMALVRSQALENTTEVDARDEEEGINDRPMPMPVIAKPRDIRVCKDRNVAVSSTTSLRMKFSKTRFMCKTEGGDGRAFEDKDLLDWEFSSRFWSSRTRIDIGLIRDYNVCYEKLFKTPAGPNDLMRVAQNLFDLIGRNVLQAINKTDHPIRSQKCFVMAPLALASGQHPDRPTILRKGRRGHLDLVGHDEYTHEADRALLKGRLVRCKIEHVHREVFRVLKHFLKEAGAVLARDAKQKNAHPVGITILLDAIEDYKYGCPDNARLVEITELQDFFNGRRDLPCYSANGSLAATAEAGPSRASQDDS